MSHDILMASCQLQDNYAKLEADMVETENASVLLKEKLSEAESAISVLKDEKGSAICTIEKMTQELENEMDQKSASVAQLEALRSEHMSMVGYLALLIISKHLCSHGLYFGYQTPRS